MWLKSELKCDFYLQSHQELEMWSACQLLSALFTYLQRIEYISNPLLGLSSLASQAWKYRSGLQISTTNAIWLGLTCLACVAWLGGLACSEHWGMQLHSATTKSNYSTLQRQGSAGIVYTLYCYCLLTFFPHILHLRWPMKKHFG